MAFDRTHIRLAGLASAMLVSVACLLILPASSAADLVQVAEWGGAVSSEPNPEDGKFRAIGDLAIGPGGTVGVFDPVLGRGQMFDPDGEFIRAFDGPQGSQAFGDATDLDFREDGTIEVFNRWQQKLYRFGNDGDPIDQIDFDLDLPVRDFSPDPSGGYIAAFGNDLRIARFDNAGGQLINWRTGVFIPDSEMDGATVEIDEHDVDDRVYMASGPILRMFSRSGEYWANWSLATEVCDLTGPGLIDLALDGLNNVYLLASLSASGERKVLFKIDNQMNEAWREPVDSVFNRLVVAADGSIYLAGSNLKVVRMERIDPAEPPVPEKCGKPVTPVTPTTPEKTSKFKLLGLKYGPGRNSARVRMYVPEAGRITVAGRKVHSRSLEVSGAGNYTLTIKAKPKFLQPSRPRPLIRLAARIRFSGSSISASRTVTVRLKGRLPKR